MWIIGIILAAGEGSRLGGPKALLRLEGESFLARTARLLAAGGAQRVVAVLGHQAERVRREAGPLGELLLVQNPRYREGMLTSILCGLDQAEAFGAAAILIHPVDHPLVDPATVGRVVAALAEGAVIAVPSFEGRRGHPGGYAAAAWPALRAPAPDRGARGVLADHAEWVVHVAGDQGCVEGINTPQEYERLRHREP